MKRRFLIQSMRPVRTCIAGIPWIACAAMWSAASASTGSARAAEQWAVRGGTTTVSFDGASPIDRARAVRIDRTGTADIRSFAILAEPTGAFAVVGDEANGPLRGLDGLRLVHDAALSFNTPAGAVAVEGFVIRNATAPKVGLVLSRIDDEGTAVLILSDVKVDVDREVNILAIECGALRISGALAAELGDPALGGRSVGTLVMEANIEWTGGDLPAPPVDDDALPGAVAGTIGPDVIVGVLSGVANYGSVDDIAAFSIGTSSCNTGDTLLLWERYTNEHPVIAQNMYRLKDDRFEQIGQSWLKHGFLALAQNACGLGCEDPHRTDRLGVGCSDPYTAGLNGDQNILGPRSEVNAHTGAFPYDFILDPTITLEQQTIARRIQVHVSDLDPALDGGGLYFVEGHYVTPDDAAAGNQNNNASYRPASVAFDDVVDMRWEMMLTGTTVREQPGIRAWQDIDPSVVEADVQVPDDGLLILSAKSIELGDGFWRYEYALHNLNCDRSARSFAVPVDPAATVRNVGFHDVDYHSGEVLDGADWDVARANGRVTWSTLSFNVDENANALRWGTLYNFRFEANVPPGENIDAIIGLFKPGAPGAVTASTVGPAGAPPVCGDGSLQSGEACDPPDEIHCDDQCQWICGDGEVQEGEECDPPNGSTCDGDCRIIYICGDGTVDPGEECDPPNGTTCDDQCARIPTCGDGVVDPGEDCDPPNETDCDALCHRVSNDHCENATTVCAGVYEGSTRDADSDGSATCGTSSNSADVWYSYTPTADGNARIETCGTIYDTVLSIHTACPGSSVNQINCNDDVCGSQSRVTFVAQAGMTYLIRVSGYDGGRGDFTLTIIGPECNSCVTTADCDDPGSSCAVVDCVDSVCVTTNLTGACDDGNACTTGDMCADGACVGGPLLPCDDPPTCTDCNANGARDDCEDLPDCNANGLPDMCEFADCNGNSINDICEIADGTTADCDGGPIGVVDDGATLFASKCGACHAADGSGDLGPDIRNHSRVDLWRMLLAPTQHTGGAHPEYSDQDFADIEAFLATASGGRPDNIPDACQTLIDCDDDGVSDGCELGAGTQVDANRDGIPDECLDDCNENGLLDAEEIELGLVPDCNGNELPDECDLADGTSSDLNENGIPDECEDPFKATLRIEGASTVAGGLSTTYRAVAHFTDGGSFEVTLQAAWSVEPEGAGAIDQLGRLTTQAVPCELPISVRATFAFDGVDCAASHEVMLTPDGTIACDDGDPCTVDQCDQGSCSAVEDATDTDGDTVPDCLDACEGFDDRDDCDRDAMPDGCENDANANGIPDDCDRKGDFDHNARIDLADFELLVLCLDVSGPDYAPPFGECVDVFDVDDDGDVDLNDVDAFFNVFTGR